MVWVSGAFLACTLLMACGGGNDTPGAEPEQPETPITPDEPKEDAELTAYKAPAYIDNYTGMAGWTQRSQWNLSNVHDPTVMRADDGYYYMYQTDASYGNVHEGHGHFHARRSKDLVKWEYLGGTMPNAPAWVKDSLNAIRFRQGLPAIDAPRYGYWAPTARNIGGGKYRMYYSIVVDNYIKSGAANTVANFDRSWTERAFIGYMETTNPADNNSWEDKGYVLCSASDKGKDDWTRPNTNDWTGYFKFNAIDPSLLVTPQGEHWLVYGSWHSGFALLQLDPETGKPLQPLSEPWNITDTSGYGVQIATRGNSRWQGSEAPELIYNATTGYYYLFMAYDALDVPYNTRVARSQNIDGPYYGIDGSKALGAGDLLPVVTHPYRFNNNNGWVGFSHCCIFDDGAGNWYYASQARFPPDVAGINASNAIMMGHVRTIRWTSDGWPLVLPERYGNVPRIAITEDELIGNWEHIDLSYSYGQQKTASVMTLGSNHKITSGTWTGATWSYDAATQILTANNQRLYLSRECDWEASPRTHTIVYSAYGTNHKTYWGKKVVDN
ncbi:MAG: arabinan endo-1,5-alpha-L-arabinosidase [Prevotellaceae bacterium]|jgi:beta-xylosidase|nr:arabinan endo-1,5-alpha-L-arabinosidase [Prevotellaceae bacterium]